MQEVKKGWMFRLKVLFWSVVNYFLIRNEGIMEVKKDLYIKCSVKVTDGYNIFLRGSEVRVDSFKASFGLANTFQDRVLIHLHSNLVFGIGNCLAHLVLVHGYWIVGALNFFGFRLDGHNIKVGDNNYLGHKLNIFNSDVGSNNIIRGNSTIRGCKIGNDCYIGANCELVGVIIEDNVVILRGTRIIAPTGTKVRIGGSTIVGECCNIARNIPANCYIPIFAQFGPNDDKPIICRDQLSLVEVTGQKVVTESINNETYSGVDDISAEEIIANISRVTDVINDRRQKLFDFVAGVWNHNMFLAVEKGRLSYKVYKEIKQVVGY